MEATTSMPCHIRWEGSISAPMFVAPVRSTSLRSVTGEKTRLCGPWGAGHRHHVRHAEQPGELDGAAQVVGVLRD
jgi:hypothetical protein